MAKISFEKAVEIALEQHQAGNFQRAEMLYMSILQQDPGNVDAIHLLGVLALQGKNPQAAYDLISAAIRKRGDAATFHYNLAEAAVALKRPAEAIVALQRATELNPDYYEAFNNLGNLLTLERRFEEAEAACRRALGLKPDVPYALNNLANALRGLGRPEEAETLYLRALELNPDFPEAANNLAMCLCTMRRVDDGIKWFRRSIELSPAVADLHNNLGVLLMSLGRHEKAGAAFQKAVDLAPEHPEANNNLGAILRQLGKPHEAIPYFQQATKVAPEFIAAFSNLAAALNEVNRKSEALEAVDAALALRPTLARELYMRAMLLRDLSRPDEAMTAVREALRLDPSNVGALTSLGYTLLELGDMDEAMATLERVLALDPDPSMHSNVLMTVNYHPKYSPADLHGLHRTWAKAHEDPHRAIWGNYANDRTPDRRLRVGYVSPDFRGHVVAHFLEPILDHHDHTRFEIFGYANLTNMDMHTLKMRAQIDHWREINGKSPDEIADKIREDRIDILVELAGHTGGNVLPVFARKPAPVQVNMIGFPSTTGLSAMDYRSTDALADPPGLSDPHNSERLLRMPRLFWVFQPSSEAPETIGPLPADARGHLTFASINNFTKVTPEVQGMWARLLKAVPDSRLILQTGAMNSARTQDNVRARFVEGGVDPARLEFRPSIALRKFFEFLNDEVDISLDPFPFNGGTTTCQSLWMGVPVLTLAGDRHASRMGLSMMTSVGLPEFVAHTPDEYVEIGQRLATDLPHLRFVRAGMRDRLKASPLLDAAGYTRELEDKYREVWAEWCATGA